MSSRARADTPRSAALETGLQCLSIYVIARNKHGSVHSMPEQELAVQVGHVDGVHVDYINVAEPRQRQVLEQLAAEAARADAQHSAVVLRITIGFW